MILDATSLVTNPRGRTDSNGNLLAVVPTIGLAIHHTVGVNYVQSEADERSTIRAIDQQHVAQGFGGFGYHYIVFPSGRAYHCGEGQRAHVAKRNHELRGVAMSGTFTNAQPTEAAYISLRRLLEVERAVWDIPIKGHREWALPGEGTECPGAIVPKDWEAFMAEEEPNYDSGGWVYTHNQILAMQNGLVVAAIGDWEGNFPGRIAKLFGNKWFWLRKRDNGEAFWSEEAGD